MSCKVQQSVCSDCVTYVKSRIKFNTFNTFNNVATKDLGTAILGTALTKDDTILAEVGGSIRRIPVSVLADVLRALASENNTISDNQ